MSQRDAAVSARVTPSLLALIAANAACAVAVLLGYWQASEVLILYWAESAVIGAFTILKILTCRGDGSAPAPWIGRLFLVGFFTVHFGIFMFVHFMFLGMVVLRGAGPRDLSGLGATANGLAFGLIALSASHMVSFVVNWWLGGERNTARMGDVFIAPYPRIIVMHLTVLAGGLLMSFVGSSPLMLVVLIVLKTLVDAAAHRREHGRAARGGIALGRE